LLSEYEQLKKKLDASCQKELARQKVLREKRAEKLQIKKAGGGKELARKILMSHDTDFDYGANESIDDRIQKEQADRCLQLIICKCGKRHGLCAEITEDRERLKMLPTGQDTQSSRNQKRGSGIEWLKIEDLTTQKQEAKILAVNYNKDGRFGARVELKLAFDGKIKYWGVPPKKDDKNPNYKELTEHFGHDENDWIDQRILLYVEPHKFYEGQFYIRVDFPSTKSGNSRKEK
jgi:hypothetical protein